MFLHPRDTLITLAVSGKLTAEIEAVLAGRRYVVNGSEVMLVDGDAASLLDAIKNVVSAGATVKELTVLPRRV